MALKAIPRNEMVQIIQSAGGAWSDSADKEKIQSTLQEKNIRFCVTPGSLSSQEAQKSQDSYFVYVLDKHSQLREASFSRDSMKKAWVHINSQNLQETDLRIIFNHVEAHKNWKGYKLVQG